MSITRTAITDDDGTGTTGTVINNAWKTELYDQIDAAVASSVPGITSSGGRITQIAFAATQSASADANTLDDYEEGTWTPVLGGATSTSGQTYGTQQGTYTKIGRDVLCTYRIDLSAKGTITGNCQLQGLPFTSASGHVAVSVGLWGGLGTNWVNLTLSLSTGATVAAVSGAAAAGISNVTALATADVTNTTSLYGTIAYKAAT